MVVTIILMVLLDSVHPPAASTALSFAFRDADEQNLVMFALALAVIGMLVVLQRALLWSVARLGRRKDKRGGD